MSSQNDTIGLASKKAVPEKAKADLAARRAVANRAASVIQSTISCRGRLDPKVMAILNVAGIEWPEQLLFMEPAEIKP